MEIGLMFFLNSVIWLAVGYVSLCVIRAVFAATGRDYSDFPSRSRNQNELFPAFKNDLITRLKAAPVVLLVVMAVFGFVEFFTFVFTFLAICVLFVAVCSAFVLLFYMFKTVFTADAATLKAMIKKGK